MNFHLQTKFQDVKALIKQECNIPDFILDNLVEDGFDSKKVRIGLTNENDGYKLMKCLEGFRMSGSHILKIIPIGKVNTIFLKEGVVLYSFSYRYILLYVTGFS